MGLVQKQNHYCFSKDNRLLSKRDFEYLRAGSSSIKEKYLALYYKDSRLGVPRMRVGFSVSKKVGNACERNRLKRLMRESIRKADLKSLSIDGLFVVSHFVGHMKGIEREKALMNSFSKILVSLSSKNQNS